MEDKNVLVALRIPYWMQKEILGDAKNKSGRIKELMVKGKLYENTQEVKENSLAKNNNGITGFRTQELIEFGRMTELAV